MVIAIETSMKVVEPLVAVRGKDLFGIESLKINSSPMQQANIIVRNQVNLIASVSTIKISETDDFEVDDEEAPIDFDRFAADDTTDTFLAKRMFSRMMCDLSSETVGGAPDMFGHIEGTRERRKLDALIWMYALNPDGSEISFEWVCNEIGFDAERIRRITGRSVRQDLKRILKIISSMVSNEHAKNCELNLMDYVNLSGWQTN